MSLLMAGGLKPDDLQGPFQPKPFYDSMIRTSFSPSLKLSFDKQLVDDCDFFFLLLLIEFPSLFELK